LLQVTPTQIFSKVNFKIWVSNFPISAPVDVGLAAYIAPGTPVQDDCVKCFNGRVRDELLNETLFLSMDDARVQIAALMEDNNPERPH
jgi:hypothetical protein